MFKNNKAIAVIITLLFLLFSGSANADAFGTKVGSYSGVSAFSNGTVSNYSGESNSSGGYRTGIKWQCVEFVNRYFKDVLGKQITGGNANSYYSNASAKGLNRAPNGGTVTPIVGSLICSNGGDYGHCAIIREVSYANGYVRVIHQNWTNTSADNSKTLSLKVTTSGGKKYYTVGPFSSSYPVVGWMW